MAHAVQHSTLSELTTPKNYLTGICDQYFLMASNKLISGFVRIPRISTKEENQIKHSKVKQLGDEDNEKNHKASTWTFGGRLAWPGKLPAGVDLRIDWIPVICAMALAFPVWIYFIILSPGYACCNTPDFLRILIVACITPIAEEIIFRGAIQTMFEKRFNRWEWTIVSAPNLLTNIVFAASHFFISFRASALLVFFPGLVFGYLRDKQKALGASIFVHGFYNLGFILIAPS
jgi:membrane protease YdiL (CAAX protease family)